MKGKWACILGASSGFGAACALELAEKGVNIWGVHLDRKATLAQVEELIQKLKAKGVEVCFFNMNAADEEKRKAVIQEMKSKIKEGELKVFLHSLAFGALKQYFSENALTKAQMDMTLDVMAHSLVYWTQDLFKEKLLGKGSKIFAMTSAGSTVVWPNYGAVSAAKTALESHIRQIAFELAPYGIAANALKAGVTDTAALQKIPEHKAMIERATSKNPSHKLTTPKDVAIYLVALSEPENSWLTGNVIGIDGGENNVG